MNEIIELLSTGIVGGLVAAYISNLSNRRKAWWDIKLSVYSDIINSLSDLKNYYSFVGDDIIKVHDILPTERELLWSEYRKGYFDLCKLINKGTFVLSKEVEEKLIEFTSKISLLCIQGYGDEEYFLKSVNDNYAETMKCLEFVIERSKVDLKLDLMPFKLNI